MSGPIRLSARRGLALVLSSSVLASGAIALHVDAARADTVQGGAPESDVGVTAGAPSAPQNVRPASWWGTNGDIGPLLITWDAPQHPGPWGVQYYTVTANGQSYKVYDQRRFKIPNMVDGVENVISVTATNSQGTSAPAVLKVDWGTAPSAPRAVTATTSGGLSEGKRNLTVRWEPALDDGGWPILGYSVSSSREGGSWPTKATAGPDATELTLRVGPGVHTVNVRTITARGYSDPVEIGPMLVADAPGKVTDLAVQAGDGTVTASWAPATYDGGSPITAYVVEADGQTCRTTELSCTLTVANGGRHHVSVRAVNAEVDGWRSYADAIPGPPTAGITTWPSGGAYVSAAPTAWWTSAPGPVQRIVPVEVRVFNDVTGVPWKATLDVVRDGTAQTVTTYTASGSGYNFSHRTELDLSSLDLPAGRYEARWTIERGNGASAQTYEVRSPFQIDRIASTTELVSVKRVGAQTEISGRVTAFTPNAKMPASGGTVTVRAQQPLGARISVATLPLAEDGSFRVVLPRILPQGTVVEAEYSGTPKYLDSPSGGMLFGQPPSSTPPATPVTKQPKPAPQPKPSPAAKPIVHVNAVGKQSKLRVDVNPDKGKGFWSFQLQVKRADGSWKALKTYTTKGSKEIRTINLPKGTYRVVVQPKYGHAAAISGQVTLKR